MANNAGQQRDIGDVAVDLAKDGKDLAVKIATIERPVNNNLSSRYTRANAFVGANATYLIALGIGAEYLQRSDANIETLATAGIAAGAGLLLIPFNGLVKKYVDWRADKINARAGDRNIWVATGKRLGQAAVTTALCAALYSTGVGLVEKVVEDPDTGDKIVQQEPGWWERPYHWLQKEE